MVGDPDGTRIIFSGKPGVSSDQQLITSPDLTHKVIISPGLPTPPLSPFHSARLPSGEMKVSNNAEAERAAFRMQVLLLVEKQSITRYIYQCFEIITPAGLSYITLWRLAQGWFLHLCPFQGVRTEWGEPSNSQLWIILWTLAVK